MRLLLSIDRTLLFFVGHYTGFKAFFIYWRRTFPCSLRAMAVAAVLYLTEKMILILPVTIVCAVLLLRTGQNSKIKGDAAVAMISVGVLAFEYLPMDIFSTSLNLSGDVCSLCLVQLQF